MNLKAIIISLGFLNSANDFGSLTTTRAATTGRRFGLLPKMPDKIDYSN
jgi:hypothetical protein